jgi:general secretion pathway protein E
MPEIHVPYSYAKTRGVFVSAHQHDAVELYVRNDTSFETLLEFQRVYQTKIKPLVVSNEEFEKKLAEHFASDGASSAFAADLESDLDLSKLIQELPQVDDLLEAEGDAPIIRMINAIFTQALRDGASDIHIEPFETKSIVRFRIDGTLRNIVEPHRALHMALISRIKVMAQLDIAEKRLPQDGRITLKIAGKIVDIRVSTLPTGHGERAVLRLLEKDGQKLNLSKLGMTLETQQAVDAIIHEPHGIFLVTGPTGSGKSTTLYAALTRLDSHKLNIMTVEDPIEYDIPTIAQTQVNPKIEMTFAKALRSILRQDPDVVMIGEIRDLETAQIAVQSSLTGHLVLATLHTNDAASALTRLIDMEIEPFLLSSSLSGVLAQRLVRRLCGHCKSPYHPDALELAQLGIQASTETLYKPHGCSACGGTGYIGRIGIYELLVVDEELRKLIHENAPEHAIKEYAKTKGMVELREDGKRWVLQGETSLEELLSVTKE